jgi:branched-chain amino acid transport system permease protein
MTVQLLVQMAITGVTLALIYGLIAIGLTLIFGVMRIIQYAHGEIFMLGAYILYYWFNVLHFPYWAGFILSAVVIFFFGAGLQLLLFRPLHGKEMLYSLAVSLALIFIISSAGIIAFRPVGRGISGFVTGQIAIAGAQWTYERIVIAAISLVLILALWFLLQRTKIGIAMRAVAEDPDTASLQGINNRRIHWVAMGLGSSLAAMAGCLYGTMMFIMPSMGFMATIKAFMIVIMGGLGSVIGALVGGLILGFIDSFLTTLASSEMAYIIGFVTIFVILVLKPSGLFGQEWE